MRTSIKGKPVIPKVAWTTKARAHMEFVDDLANLQRALEVDGSIGHLLQALYDIHLSDARICDDIAKDTKPGRPRVNAKADESVQKKRPGRPSALGPDFDRASFDRKAYVVVEERRAKLGTPSRPSTIKAAIDSLNAGWARESNKREIDVVRAEYQSMRAAHGRGKTLLRA